MNVLISSAAVLLALAASASTQAAGREGGCSVTHTDCYPACVAKKMTPDGEDCAQTREVCREICGPKPVYPGVSNTERSDIMRFETLQPMPDPDAQRLEPSYSPPE